MMAEFMEKENEKANGNLKGLLIAAGIVIGLLLIVIGWLIANYEPGNLYGDTIAEISGYNEPDQAQAQGQSLPTVEEAIQQGSAWLDNLERIVDMQMDRSQSLTPNIFKIAELNALGRGDYSPAYLLDVQNDARTVKNFKHNLETQLGPPPEAVLIVAPDADRAYSKLIEAAEELETWGDYMIRALDYDYDGHYDYRPISFIRGQDHFKNWVLLLDESVNLFGNN